MIAIGLFSYLLGSIPFGVIICRLWRRIDIRDYGSKNAGFTNVYRVVGAIPAIFVLVLDIAKGAAAVVLITRVASEPLSINFMDLKLLAGVFVILGHVFPLFAGFRGGKGIATGLGALVSIIPLEVALALILFWVIVAVTRFVSLGSIFATTFVFLALVFERYYLGKEVPITLFVMIFLLTVFIFFNHRSNIKRLLNGTENRFEHKGTESNSNDSQKLREKS